MNTAKYERVAAASRQQLHTAKLEPGDQLPATQELVDSHGVSYGSIRTALLIVKAEGLIEGRQRAARGPAEQGVFVRDPDGQ